MSNPPARCCASCGTAHYLPSLTDPRICYRCIIWPGLWSAAIFGRVRKVPRTHAAEW